MRLALIVALTVVFALAAGCSKKDANKPVQAKPVPAAPAAPDETKAEPAEKAPPVATKADFEEEAAKEISSDNLDKQLGDLEKEIGE